MYSYTTGRSYSGYYVDSSNTNVPFHSYFSGYSGPVFRSAGSSFSVDMATDSWNKYQFIYFFIQFNAPVCTIVPYDSLIDEINSTYNITTRPTSVTGGNYGIIGDDGTLNIITVNDSIVNEYNNTYYNPATGKGDTITSWSYDYSDRSYNVTLESGDTVTQLVIAPV